MKTKCIVYDYIKSFERIDEILKASDSNFEELNEIPSREKLTYTNGYYVNCSALFVDIRDSSELPKTHRRPTLAKIYRAYISEVVAIMNGNVSCAEIVINGDSVAGIYNTPLKSHLDGVFSDAARVASLVKVLNSKLRRKDISEIRVGIGASWGRALMIQAGYSGSTINDVVWMGDVVNEACKLCNYALNTSSDRQIMVSDNFHYNLNEENQKLLSRNKDRGCYHGSVVNVWMDEWYENNCS